MKEKRVTKKAILASLLSVVVCTSMLIGTSYAWFTDSVSSTGNVIKSGKLEIGFEYAETKDVTDIGQADWQSAENKAIFTNELWEPGYVDSKFIRIKNNGSLALKYVFTFEPNGVLTKTADGKTLADAIDVYWYDSAEPVATRDDLDERHNIGALSNVLNSFANATTGRLKAGESDTVTLALKMRETVGNEYQGMDLGTDFSLILLATQDTYETDSFDDQYDKDAEYPVIVAKPVEDPTQPLVLTADGVTVTVPVSAIAQDDYFELRVLNKSVTDGEFGQDTLSCEIELYKNGTKVTSDGATMYNVQIVVDGSTYINNVKHNGADVANFDYDSATKTVSFDTDSFSPFAVGFMDSETSVYVYDNSKSVMDNGAAARAAIDNAEIRNVYLTNGTYDFGSQITLDGVAKNIIGMGNSVTIEASAKQHMFTLQDQFNANSNVEFNIKNLTVDGKNTSKHGFNVKYNVVCNLENVTVKNTGWAPILLDNGNPLNGGNFVSNVRTVVNCKNVKAEKVSMDALPNTSYPVATYPAADGVTTYTEFNYDSDSQIVVLEKQNINTGVDNIVVNGKPVSENGTVAPVGEVTNLAQNQTFPEGTVIKGDGPDKSTLHVNAVNGDGYKANTKNVTFKDTTIDGSEVTSSGKYNSVVNVEADGVVMDNVVVTGGGKTTWNSSILVENLKSNETFTIKNSTVSGSTRGILRESCTANLVVDNCVIDALYPINCDGGNSGNVTVTNSTFRGWTSYSGGTGLVFFENVVFEKGIYGYNVIAAYKDTTLKDCTFKDGFDLYNQTPGFTWNVNNCTYVKADGTSVAVTADNFKSLFTDPDVWNKSTCYVNGVLVPADVMD